jgi:hypothetical protein
MTSQHDDRSSAVPASPSITALSTSNEFDIALRKFRNKSQGRGLKQGWELTIDED